MWRVHNSAANCRRVFAIFDWPVSNAILARLLYSAPRNLYESDLRQGTLSGKPMFNFWAHGCRNGSKSAPILVEIHKTWAINQLSPRPGRSRGRCCFRRGSFLSTPPSACRPSVLAASRQLPARCYHVHQSRERARSQVDRETPPIAQGGSPPPPGTGRNHRSFGTDDTLLWHRAKPRASFCCCCVRTGWMQDFKRRARKIQ